ncbi:class II aldolase/adducin family protein [Sneathiella glossodoripedis]|uniref:class II aldolase/adducin family protein n=1 Tax=Sneathiella glossodoripedis TaxID=418853 RepID=UPI0004718C4D|nr:class II aldolase/adducin family protein [Sneathiella glossodoripedis]
MKDQLSFAFIHILSGRAILDTFYKLRENLISTVLKMNELGINQGTAGNASVRVDGGFLITPSGMKYEELTPEDIVFKKFDGPYESLKENRKPSSEWQFHEDILVNRKEISAVIHTHGKAAMTIACLGKDIPPFHYMIGIAGGSTIRCAPYHTFGTKALSLAALDALNERKACLLANHGQIALGSSLQQALDLAMEVETLCDVYWRTLAVGGPALLDEAQMGEVFEQFGKGYGQNPKDN